MVGIIRRRIRRQLSDEGRFLTALATRGGDAVIFTSPPLRRVRRRLRRIKPTLR